MMQHHQQNMVGQRNSLFGSGNNHNEKMNIEQVDGRDNKNKSTKQTD